MPIYEYRWRDWGRSFEKRVFGDEQPECPQCEGHQVARLLSVPAPGRVREGAAAAVPRACAGCPSARGDGSCGA